MRNKLDLRDGDLLEEAEAAFAATAAEAIELSGPPFDLAYLCSLHRQLFEDVYEWAGKVRAVDVSKGTTRFCTVDRIVPEADRIFAGLAREDYFSALDREALVNRSAQLYDDLNVVHPFREGNGRALRLFFEHLILSCGFGVSWVGVGPAEWIAACIAAYEGNASELERIFNRCVGDRLS